MNAPWYDPQQIDWTDGLNTLAIPAYREQRNPFVYRALQSDIAVALRSDDGYEPTMYTAPADEVATIGPFGTSDTIVNLPAGAFIVGLSASSQQAAGFLAQITLPSGKTLAAKPISSQDLTGAKPLWLSTPTGIPDGGPVRIRIINLSAANNLCQLCVWCAEPIR